jgi:hypothetical protein
MTAFLPLHIAAIVLLAGRLHVLHSREHAPEKFNTLTRQSQMADPADGGTSLAVAAASLASLSGRLMACLKRHG